MERGRGKYLTPTDTGSHPFIDLDMGRQIGFSIYVDERCVTEFISSIESLNQIDIGSRRENADVWVRGVHGVSSVFRVSHTKAEEMIKGVLRPSIYRDNEGHILMHLKTAFYCYYKETTKE